MWPFGPFGSAKYFNFWQKLPIRTTQHTFPESRHSEVTENPYYVLYPEWSQKKGISSWATTNIFFVEMKNAYIKIASENLLCLNRFTSIGLLSDFNGRDWLKKN